MLGNQSASFSEGSLQTPAVGQMDCGAWRNQMQSLNGVVEEGWCKEWSPVLWGQYERVEEQDCRCPSVERIHNEGWIPKVLPSQRICRWIAARFRQLDASMQTRLVDVDWRVPAPE